jgi:hypothetical protein
VVEVELTLKVEVCEFPEEMATLRGFREKVGPLVLVGDTEAERLMVPLNPFWLATLIVDVADVP